MHSSVAGAREEAVQGREEERLVYHMERLPACHRDPGPPPPPIPPLSPPPSLHGSQTQISCVRNSGAGLSVPSPLLALSW